MPAFGVVGSTRNFKMASRCGEEEGQPEQSINGNKKHSFEPCSLPIRGNGIYYQHGTCDSDQLEGIRKNQVHWMAYEVRDQDQGWCKQESYLNRRAYTESHDKIHPILSREVHCRDDLCCIANDRKHGDAEEPKGQPYLTCGPSQARRNQICLYCHNSSPAE